MNGQVDQKKAEKIGEMLLPYLPAAVQAWVDGLTACKCIWNPETKAFEETDIPDHKIRGDHVLRIIEFAVGKAIERSMEITGNYKELTQVLEELKASPEARGLLPPELWGMIEPSGQSNVEGKDAAPGHEGEEKSNPEQKTG